MLHLKKYYALFCPDCHSKMLDAVTVRDLVRHVRENTAVGVLATYLKCPGCYKKWGVVIAADKRCWMISTVDIGNLQQEYHRIKEAIKKGMDIQQVLLWTYQYKIKGNVAS